MEIDGLSIEIERKPIKHLHLAVYPPDGRVHLSMPEDLKDDDARLFIVAKWQWIERQRKDILEHPRQTERMYISGENHYFLGERYILNVREMPIPPCIVLKGNQMYMYVRPGTSPKRREEALREWYRGRLQNIIAPLMEKWGKKMNEADVKWQVHSMKDRWGSCTIRSRRILFNIELARVPQQCIEYIVVHELLHLREKNHNKIFEALLTKYLPDWQKRRKTMNAFIALPMNGNI